MGLGNNRKLVIGSIIGLALVSFFTLNQTYADSFDFEPVLPPTDFRDWQIEGKISGPPPPKHVIALTDLDSTTFLSSLQNNDHDTFNFDFSSLAGFRIDVVTVTINAETTVSNGATKIEILTWNGTHFVRSPDIFLTTTPTTYSYTMTSDPHTLAPWDLALLDTYEIGFAMQTDAKKTHVFDLDVNVIAFDDEPPVITLIGPAAITLEAAVDTYVEQGATASDLVDGDFPATIGGDVVDDTTPGVYVVTYDAVDVAGNNAIQVTRTVTVEDTIAPVITLIGPAAITLEAAVDTYVEQGATASDLVDGDFPATIGGDVVDDTTPGVYVVTYDAVDVAGNNAIQVTRTVTVEDTQGPVLTIPADVTVTAQGVHTPANTLKETATAFDVVAGVVAVTNNAPGIDPACFDGSNSGNVDDCFPPGITLIVYSATDGTNLSQATQTITVEGTALDMGWHNTSFVTGFFLSTEIDTNISTGIGEQQVRLTDYRGNADARFIDVITFEVTSLDGTISVTATEKAKNVGIFDSDVITFTNLLTDDPNDELHVVTGETATADYDASSIFVDPDHEEVAQITTDIVDTAQGLTATTDFTCTMDKEGYLIGESGTLSCFDSDQAGNGVQFVPGGAQMGSPTNSALGSCANPGTTSDIGIKLQEDSDDTGHFTGTVQIGFKADCSDRPNKIIAVTEGDIVTFGYNIDNADGKISQFTVNIVAPSGNDILTDTTGADYGVVIDVTGNDRDGDGLHDDWETPNGLSITYDVEDEFGNVIDTIRWEQGCGPGTPFPICPNPDIKDMFVELDYMQFHQPDDRAIEDAVEAFANAPVCNPGGDLGCTQPYGINLHVLIDDQIPHEEFQSLEEFHASKAINFLTNTERNTDGSGNSQCSGCIGTPTDMATLKRQVYHYNQWIHDQLLFPGSSGDGEKPGNDFRVSLGSWAGGTGTVREQAATFMHEGGHNLNLDHGGGGPLNCKSNMISIMNYCFQMPDLVGLDNHRLSFSSETLNTLDSNFLVESVGVNLATFVDPDGVTQTLKTVYGGFDGIPRTALTGGGGIDWDSSGTVDPNPNNSVAVPINNVDIPGVTPTATLRVIPTVNQWTIIVMDFKGSDKFQNGAIQQETTDNLGRGIDEPGADTFEEILALRIDAFELLLQQRLADEDIPNDDCTGGDIALLQTLFDGIREQLTNDEPRRDQLKKAAKLLSDLESSGLLLACLGPDAQLAGGEFTNDVISSSNAAATMTIGDVEIDIASKGVIDIVIFGTPVFDVFNILPPSVLLAGENDDVGGGEITHEFSANSFKKQHYKDVNQDGNTDLFLHFTQNELGLSLADNDENGQQRVCVRGLTLDDPPLPFNACDTINVVKVVGKGKGPNK